MAESDYNNAVPRSFVKEVEELSEFKKKDRLNIIKEVFKIGIEEKRKEYFIDLIEKEKIFRKVDVDNIRRLIIAEFNTEI